MAKLYFYYSTMNAGKSTLLLQAAYNYSERGMVTRLYSFLGTNETHGKISSRIGIAANAIKFDNKTNFSKDCENSSPKIDCILVDEAQFLTKEQVRQLAQLVDESNIPVMCYGLRTDFQGELFSGSAALLAWADTLSELKTICCCGRKATMVVRVNADGKVEQQGAQVEIGGNERYVPLCRKHFSESISTGFCTGWKKPRD